MTAKADTQSILQTYELPSPPAKVWRALTEPELLARWLMNNDIRVPKTTQFSFGLRQLFGDSVIADAELQPYRLRFLGEDLV